LIEAFNFHQPGSILINSNGSNKYHIGHRQINIERMNQFVYYPNVTGQRHYKK